MKIVCLSDTHNFYSDLKIPECDIMIHAGDLQAYNRKELNTFCKWVDNQNARFKVVIAGNHDKYIAENNVKARKILGEHCIYLENSMVVIDRLRIYGTPITPVFGKWYFMGEDEYRQNIFSNIPEDIDILITHSPPLNILDKLSHGFNTHVGDFLLNSVVRKCFNLKYHIFGHIHESCGMVEYDKIKFVNCSICDEFYNISNKPIVINL